MSKLKTFSLLLLLSASVYSSFSQELTWKLGYNYFFDNAEYSVSTYAVDQTMHGMNLMPELGLKLDDRQTVYAGVSLLKKAGSPSFTDGEDFMAYYQYKTPKVLIRAGAFPREDMLDNYSILLLKDSIRYFRPIMHGLFVNLKNENKLSTRPGVSFNERRRVDDGFAAARVARCFSAGDGVGTFGMY